MKDNKTLAGIYQWTHIPTGRKYIGSSSNLSQRFSSYFSKPYLERTKSMHICNALRVHGYEEFSLVILVYIEIPNLSKEDARKLIVSCEQDFLNSLSPEFNKSPRAGTSLGLNIQRKLKQL